MSNSRDASDITGTATTPQQTETSPLKQNDTKKNWFSNFLWNSASDNDQGSLRTIILNFFIFTVVVTLGLIAQIYYGGYENQPHGTVASDSYECSEIGVNILKKGGNAVDAAIASTMCMGVVNFHITGLGGGGYMMIYNHKKQEVIDIIDFYASVPNSLLNREIDISIDGLTVGVPGLLMGMWEAHQKYGKLHWEELIEPASNLAKKGFLVSKSIISARSHLNTNSRNSNNLAQFLNSLQEGQNITFPALASTLDLIAITGPHALYNGSLAMDIVYSVKKANGSMTLNDISQYELSHSEPLQTKFGNFEVLAAGASSGASGGAFLLNALDTIQFLDLTSSDDISNIVLRLSDILHDTYVSFLEKNDAGAIDSEPTASIISAVDSDEIYVVAVSGLNSVLGSQLLTEGGFILNNAIVNGGINDQQRPLSLSTPVIALESGEICGKRLVLGSGDATIAAQVLTNALILNYNLTASVESPRFFIDKIPRHIRVEDLHSPFYDPPTINKLKLLLNIDGIPEPYKSVNVIQKTGDNVVAHSDSRGGGFPSQF